MRVFTYKEQEYLRSFSEKKEIGDLQELQVSHLLRSKLSNIALRWCLPPKKSIKLYYITADVRICMNDIMKSYYEIVDFIYFIEELEANHLIKIQNMSFSIRNVTMDHCLYDDTRYKYDELKKAFVHVDGESVGLLPITNKEVDNSFVLDLEKYINAYIFPLPALDDLVANHFKDFDQRVFEENKNSNQKALNYSRKAISQTNKSLKQTSCMIKISIAALVLSIISVLSVIIPILFDDSPNHSDMQNIESAILQKKTITIDSIAKYNADTINMNITNKPQLQPIDVKVITVPNQSLKKN